MRPKNLKFPFTWEQRRPAFYEGVLIVPQHYQKHDKWVDEENLFSKKTISIEYCSGNGDWVIEKAQKNPSRFWVAVEMQFERVRKIWSKMHNLGVENLLIVCGEALTFTRHYLPEDSIEEIFVNFPDPWPKERHEKHRLIQMPFIEQLARVVKKGGSATFATDDEPYSVQMTREMDAHPAWEKGYYTQDWEDYGSSWFQNLWREKGRQFHYMQFEKR